MNREAYPPCLLFALLNDLLHKQIKLSYHQSTFIHCIHLPPLSLPVQNQLALLVIDCVL